MLKNEWKKLFQNKFMIVVMIAIIPDTDNLHGNFCGSHVGPVWKGGTSSGCSCK